MFTPELIQRAAALIALCRARGLKSATAESCTGGLVAGLLTEIPGSSAVARARLRRLFQRGQAGASRRARSDARRFRRGQRTDRARHGARRDHRIRKRISRWRSPALPDPTAARRKSRSAWSISPARERTATSSPWRSVTGRSSRGAIRLASVETALDLLEQRRPRRG